MFRRHHTHDGETYDQDIVIDRGEVPLGNKKPSKLFRDQFSHTPLSVEETIPGSALGWSSARACKARYL